MRLTWAARATTRDSAWRWTPPARRISRATPTPTSVRSRSGLVPISRSTATPTRSSRSWRQAGWQLEYAGYLGGAALDQGLGVALAPSGSLIVVGHTHSSEATFPVARGPNSQLQRRRRKRGRLRHQRESGLRPAPLSSTTWTSPASSAAAARMARSGSPSMAVVRATSTLSATRRPPRSRSRTATAFSVSPASVPTRAEASTRS